MHQLKCIRIRWVKMWFSFALWGQFPIALQKLFIIENPKIQPPVYTDAPSCLPNSVVGSKWRGKLHTCSLIHMHPQHIP